MYCGFHLRCVRFFLFLKFVRRVLCAVDFRTHNTHTQKKSKLIYETRERGGGDLEASCAATNHPCITNKRIDQV